MKITIPFLICLLAILAPAPLPGQDVNAIIKKAVVADRENQKVASRYLFNQNVTVEKLGKDGTVRSSRNSRFLVKAGEGISYEVTGLKGQDESVLVAGETYDFSDNATATKHDVRKGANNTRRVSTPVDVYRESISMEDLADKYTFKLKGQETIGGRECHLIEFTPKEKVKTRGRTEKVMAHMGGRLWIDTQEYALVKCQSRLLKPLSIAWFFATLRELELEYQAQKLSQGVWMPKSLNLKFTTRTFVSVSIKRQKATMSDFRKLRTTSREKSSSPTP